ncbi:MAG: hypothetical protein ACLTV6_14215 [Christensenellales bacterium]
MRLGVVLTGIGACAAASAGALTWLLDAGVAPYAVCGMQAAAWPAALYLVGYDADRQRGAAVQAARAGRRLLTADASARDVLGMKKSAICRGRRLEKLLAAQTGERALGLCERQGVFLCRAARSGHVVAFCTQSVTQDGAIVTLQASTAFAARAALSRPPFVSPMEWMGSPLLPRMTCRWPAACCKRCAQRVLVVARDCAPPSAGRARTGKRHACHARGRWKRRRFPHSSAGEVRCRFLILLGADAGAGRRAEMEAALMRLGMPLCRVLPFRRKLTAP